MLPLRAVPVPRVRRDAQIPIGQRDQSRRIREKRLRHPSRKHLAHQLPARSPHVEHLIEQPRSRMRSPKPKAPRHAICESPPPNHQPMLSRRRQLHQQITEPPQMLPPPERKVPDVVKLPTDQVELPPGQRDRVPSRSQCTLRLPALELRKVRIRRPIRRLRVGVKRPPPRRRPRRQKPLPLLVRPRHKWRTHQDKRQSNEQVRSCLWGEMHSVWSL
jgi:hypothetical protein